MKLGIAGKVISIIELVGVSLFVDITGGTVVDFLKKGLLLVLGIGISSLGIVFTQNSQLGMSPWDALYYGLCEQIGISFGELNILIGAVLIVISMILGVKPGFATFFNVCSLGNYG